MKRRFVIDQRQRGIEIVERSIGETRSSGSKPSRILGWLVAEIAPSSPVKGVVEGDQLVFFRLAVGGGNAAQS